MLSPKRNGKKNSRSKIKKNVGGWVLQPLGLPLEIIPLVLVLCSDCCIQVEAGEAACDSGFYTNALKQLSRLKLHHLLCREARTYWDNPYPVSTNLQEPAGTIYRCSADKESVKGVSKTSLHHLLCREARAWCDNQHSDSRNQKLSCSLCSWVHCTRIKQWRQ